MRLSLPLFALPATALLLSACLTTPGMVRPRGVGDCDLPADVSVTEPGTTTVVARRCAPAEIVVYDVRDLIAPRAEFLPPRITGLPIESDDAPPASGGEGESWRLIEPDMLLYTIEQATDPEYWAETEGASMEISEGGALLVRTPR